MNLIDALKTGKDLRRPIPKHKIGKARND